jgi:hypothetical protein
MAGYLEGYGIADERRSKTIRWIVISAVLLAVIAGLGFWFLRTYPAKKQVRAFLDDLKRHDYQAAYRDWGCAQSCPDYNFNSFLRDWGPGSPFANAEAADIRKARYCDTGGTIVTVAAPKGDPVFLWYQRDSHSLGFAPWEGICSPHIPAPTSPAPAP